MNKIKSIIAAGILALAMPAMAFAEGQTSGDPCATWPKKSASVAIATGTTTVLITGVSGLKTYVCDYNMVTVATTTAQLESGTTGGTCGTPTVLTGAYPASTQATVGGGTASVLVAAASADICVLSTGTIIAGSIGYVQAP